MSLKTGGRSEIIGRRFNLVLEVFRYQTLDGFDFIDQLSGKRVAQVVVGDDFRFGCDRQGDFDYLLAAGNRSGFKVEQTETHLLDGVRVSSSRIRELLRLNDLMAPQECWVARMPFVGEYPTGNNWGGKLASDC